MGVFNDFDISLDVQPFVDLYDARIASRDFDLNYLRDNDASTFAINTPNGSVNLSDQTAEVIEFSANYTQEIDIDLVHNIGDSTSINSTLANIKLEYEKTPPTSKSVKIYYDEESDFIEHASLNIEKESDARSLLGYLNNWVFDLHYDPLTNA